MITFTSGNLLDSPADIRINTVNCVGVMGAGVALAFRKKYLGELEAMIMVFEPLDSLKAGWTSGNRTSSKLDPFAIG